MRCDFNQRDVVLTPARKLGDMQLVAPEGSGHLGVDLDEEWGSAYQAGGVVGRRFARRPRRGKQRLCRGDDRD